MHEWALAEAVAKAVESSKVRGITKVRILLGELQNVAQDVFSEALSHMLKRPYEIVIQPATFKCRTCSHEWKLSDVKSNLTEEELESIHFIPEVVHAFLKCPNCSSADFEITQGRGVSLELITEE